MGTSQPRKPAGTPAGGQFAPTSHAEPDIHLSPSGDDELISLDRFVGQDGKPLFPDPDDVGQSEYRAIHELVSTVVDSVEVPPDEAPLAAAAIEIDGCLAEVEDWVWTLRKRIATYLPDKEL